MEAWTKQHIFDTALKHFEIIAEQRLKTYNFYVILLAASVGGTLSAFEKSAAPAILTVCGLFNLAAACVFWAIDLRTRRLLDIPKKVMLQLERGEHWPPELRLFDADVAVQAKLHHKVLSYTGAFWVSFTCHILFGAWTLHKAGWRFAFL